MIKILSIGNSFSQDAQRYLHRISVAAETPIKSVNLYIGGCTLRTHYFNMLENAQKYQFEFNGENTGIFVTIKEALMSDAWGFVTLQQASLDSAHWETYEPYLSELAAYVRRYAPQAKLLIHQTWAYDAQNHERLEKAGFSDPKEMYNAVRTTYKKAADQIGASGIIPTGYGVSLAIQNGLSCPYRDGFHLSIGGGRYLAALLWFCYLTGKSPNSVPCPALDKTISDEELRIIKKTVETVTKNSTSTV